MRPARLLLALLCLAVPATAGAANRIAFKVDWGPIAVAEAEVTIRREAGRTWMNGRAAARGLGALLSGFTLSNAVRYGPEGREIRVEILREGATDLLEMAWTPGGDPVILAAGEPEEEPLTPIPPGELAGTVDPFFPFLDMMARLDSGGDCTRAYRVYDGTRRYDLTFADQGSEAVEADRRWTYDGPARRCSLHFQRIGGFEVAEDRPVREAEIDRRIWFARLDGAHVPVRFAVDWALGTAVARIDLR